jgi:hypothetical protein
VREPGPRLALVYAEPLQALEEVVRERRPTPLEIVADEHADAPRLAVVLHREDGPPSAPSSLPQRPHDGLEVRGRPGAEKGHRDVQVLGRDDPAAAPELARLPGNEALDRVVGQAERAEEPKAFTALDGSGIGVPCLCQLCDKTRRAR